MNQSKINRRKMGLSGKNLKLLFPVWSVVLLLWLFSACNPSQIEDELLTRTETLTSNTNTNITPTTQEPSTPIMTRTPFLSMTVSPIPSKTAQPESIAPPTNTRVIPSPTALPTSYPPQGTLLIAGEGFYLLPLESGNPTYLLEKQEDWIAWRPTFSPAGDRVVYWVKTEEATELWTTSVSSWAPEQLLYLPETDYTNVTYYWLNTTRHLFVQFYELNEATGVTEKIAASYIFDLADKKVLSPSGWKGICTILAVSPQTNHLSTWCPIEDDESSGQLTYLVVELDESVWVSEASPQIVLSERENWADWNQMWKWSGDGRYVAYTIFDLVDGEVTDMLYYSRTDRNEPVVLSDGRTETFGLLSLSRDGQYITYPGICQDGVGCRLVMQTATQDVVWTSQMDDPPNMGSELYWSPDNKFFARNNFSGIQLIDIVAQEVVLAFDNVPVAEAMVWLED